ncbi:hypothetical protein [Streptomyces sp. NPDC091383]|uniref:hypothetical protein n=1 Tax=Streptomyces sp. NPDC091383 TaxID=3365996 RepID=UPI0038153C28
MRRPAKPTGGTLLADLPGRDEYLILGRQDENAGDGVPTEHYPTLTVSQEKVLHALLGWMLGEPGW